MTTEDVVLKAVAATRVAELTATAASYSPGDIGPATAPLYPELFRRLGAAGEAKAMDLADDRIARHAMAKLGRNLARAPAIEPQLPQQLHSFIRPRHRWPRLWAARAAGPQPVPPPKIDLAESPVADCPATLASPYAPKRSREGLATTCRGV